MKKRVPSNKNGAILVIVMAVLVAFSLLTVALLQLGSFNERETIRQLRTTQARWLAEAGLERALSRVATSRAYRKNLPGSEPSGYSTPESLGNGEYAVKAWEPVTGEKIVIRSTGVTTNGGIAGSATVQLSLSYQSGLPGSIIGLGVDPLEPGYTDLGDDVRVVDGDVYRNGIMEIRGTVDLDQSVYATGGSITGGGTFNENYIPTPEPPVIDNDGRFAGLIAKAKLQPPNTMTNISGINYYNGNYTSPGNISGSLVVSGTLTFNGNNAIIADNVEIVVDGNITVSQHTTFKNNVEIFSQNGNISLEHDIEGGAVAFIAKNGSLGHITTDYNNNLGVIDTAHLLPSGHEVGNIKKNDFIGILYAKYDIILSQKADINGSIIAGRNMDLGKDTGNEFRVTYDPTVFNGAWQIYFLNEIILSDGSIWEELPSP